MGRSLLTRQDVIQEVQTLCDTLSKAADKQPTTLLLASLLTLSSAILSELLETVDNDSDSDMGSKIAATIVKQRIVIINQTLLELIDSRVGQ